MKKVLLAAAIGMALSAGAQAAGVKIYGVADLSLGYFAHKVDGQETKTSVAMDSGRWMGPRWGITGSEKINDDVKISFVLESGVNVDTGTIAQGGVFFGRESQLSVETPYGTVAFGRMGNLASGNGTYCMGGKEVSPFVAALGIAGHFNYLFGNERYDNMVTYRSPKFNGFTLYAQHSLQTSGDEAEDTGNNNRYTGVGINWRSPSTYVAVIAEHYRYANNASPNYDDANTLTLVANHQLGAAKVFASAQYLDGVPYLGMPNAVNVDGRIGKGSTTGATSEKGLEGYAGSVSLAYNIGGGIAKTSLAFFDVEDGGNDNEYQRLIFGVGYQYPLSKTTGLYAQANYAKTKRDGMTNAETPTAMKDVAHHQFMFGMYHRF